MDNEMTLEELQEKLIKIIREIHSFIGLDDVLELWSIGTKIPLSDIYEDVKDLVLPQHK